MVGGVKRDRDGNARAKSTQDLPRGRFHAMFENFRDELDEHYDRRERIIKASRDVTAQSKKMLVNLKLILSLSSVQYANRNVFLLSYSIFTLQRYH